MVVSLTATPSLGADPKASTKTAAAGASHEALKHDAAPVQTVDDLVRNRAHLFPDAPIVSYPSRGIEYVDYTMKQLDVFAYRVACHYRDHLPVRTSSTEKPMVVALLGPSNFEYLVTMLALIKMGHTVLLLSTRISNEAIESLLRTTSARGLLVDGRYSAAANAMKSLFPGMYLSEIASRAVFEFPVEAHAETRLDTALDHNVETSNFVYIIHSSGSTGLPKPIFQTHKAALANYAVHMNMKAFITLPLFHNHGICNFFRAIYSGKSIHMYNADLPLTSEYLIAIMRQHHFEIFYGVPYALKLLAESEAGIALLRDLKIVMYGGSACPDELGDLLVSRGVNLVSHYGATEVGQLMTSFRPPGDNAWNYVREHDRLSPYLKWIPRGPNLYECCVLEGWPAKLTSNQPDGSYATKDLFEPHPTIPRAWKYIARLDDTLVLVNGEKFNPVQMEGKIRSDPSVAETVVFGAGRPYLGLLVVPAPSTKGLSQEQILERIWPVVEAANASVEAYARISKHMIKILPQDTQYPRTDKGSIIRQAFYKTFDREINEAYDAADAQSGDSKAMDADELRQFLRATVAKVMSRDGTIGDDDDFFALGMDSLQAIQLRSELLRNVDMGGKTLGQNVAFDHPSIKKLTTHLLSLRTGTVTEAVSIEEEMESLVEKYSQPTGQIRLPRSSVVVTGATGSLGAHVVARLALDPQIARIYCLVRSRSDEQALDRVKESLFQRRLYHTLPLTSRAKLVALPFDQSDEYLGLERGTYKTIAADLRTVIHCAWSVNFNLHLSSFERDCIAGVRNLLNLCLAGGHAEPASFNFCSSVSAVARAPETRVPETLAEYAWAQGMGYAQSKSVAEHLCLKVASQTGVQARVLRVGQIIGDTRHGIWNAAEAIPMMMQTALTVGALPRLEETPSWLPVDTVAQAVLDVSLSPDAGSLVTHITNSRTFHWTRDLLPALRAAGLEFEEVEPREWVRRLRASNPDPRANPPYKLVDFFASKYERDEFAPSKSYETRISCGLSRALAEAPVLNQDTVNKFVRYFLDNAWRAAQQEQQPASLREKPRVIVVGGPCGTGKTTVGEALAARLGGAFVEGDTLHTREAVQRMRSGTPLGDEDRYSWLDRIRRRIVSEVEELGYDVVVVSCSALRRAYRDRLRELRGDLKGVSLTFIDLQASAQVLKDRVARRTGHYMPASLVESQIAAHEEPQEDEVDVIPVGVEGSRDDTFREVDWVVKHVLHLDGVSSIIEQTKP
ncbi:hypothetical protein VTK73DRAFT_4887 [Phialemonium thermophilum]|uniref:gluconokinase n=1 Tax=Phialemonium thermophilum TaxID=223376 RepID=A0ABR3WRC7_9PEZI